MALDNYLRDQAIRLLRTKWPVPYQLAEELFLILRGIQVDTSGPFTVKVPGFDPFVIPPFPDLGLDPIDYLDLDLPEFEPVIPNIYNYFYGDDNDPGDPPPPNGDDDDQPSRSTTVEERDFFHKTIFLGRIMSQASGENFNVRLYPYGFLVEGAGTPFTPDFDPTPGAPVNPEPVNLNVEAQVTDPDLASEVPIGTWIFVYRVIEYHEEKRTRRRDEAIVDVETRLEVLQKEHFFNAPSSGGEARVAAVKETITGRDGLTPGSGKATLYQFTEGELAPRTQDDEENPGEQEEVEVTVYNMVTSKIKKGADEDKFIQVKKIDGVWWIDVEDCSTEDEEEDTA